MAFDSDHLQPLYRLEIGLPGQSQALHIARAVGIDPGIVERAGALLGQRDERQEEIIDHIQNTRRLAEVHKREAEAYRHQAAGHAAELQQRVEEVDRRGSWLREEAEHFVEEELRTARELLSEPLRHFLNAPRPFDEKAKGLLLLLDGLLTRSSLGRRREKYVAEIRKGHFVYVPRFRRRGEVVRVDRRRRMFGVRLGDLTMEVGFDEVSWLQPLDSS
jgi:DNA mismatch repair protein MutS2